MATPAIVQSFGKSTASSVSAQTYTLPSTTTAGNFIAVWVTINGSGVTVTVTDSAANTYHQAGVYAGTGADRAALFYAYNIAGGAVTVTVTPSAAAFLTVAVAEISGVKSSADPLGVSSSNTGTTVTTLAAGSLTISTAQTIVLATFTIAASGKIPAVQNGGLVFSYNGGNEPSAAFFAVVDSTVNPTIILDTTSSYSAVGATFAAAGGGGGAGGGGAPIIGSSIVRGLGRIA